MALAVRLETERGRRLDRAFESAAAGLDPRERRFAQELSYGTTRLRARLDHRIRLELHGDARALEAPVLEALRLGAYQLLHMDSVPPYAAVSQTVDLVRSSVGDGPTGLVNAVLRKVERGGDAVASFPSWASDPIGYLETWGSHPRWLLERWLDRWTLDEVRALVDLDNRAPRHHLVPLDLTAAEATRILRRCGIEGEPVGEGSRCVRLADGVAPAAALSALPHALIQDPAAALVVQYADLPRGMKVADLCAAPGGKALAAADRAVYTLAADRSESRLHMLRDNARRTGRSPGMAVADATQPPLREVDVVLLDAPCTGTGTLRRKPDARWRLEPASLDDMVALQREMLAAAAPLLPPGGLLVYSTCSLEREENEGQVDAFLRRHPTFRVEATEATPARYLDGRGCLTVTPQGSGFDGAFAARLRRAS